MRVARTRRADEGASLVEFALVLPLLALMLFGIVDFGYAMNRDTLVNNAAREGAREASLNPDPTAIEHVVKEALSDLDESAITVSAICLTPDDTTPETESCDFDDEPAGNRARVTVSYDHDWITFAPSWVGLGSDVTFTKSVEMRIE